MSFTSSVGLRKTPVERSDSDLRIDLHVYVVPSDLWQKHLHSVVNQVISDTVSAGFIRVLPETTIADVREELANQIDDEVLPKNYIFLRCVGRCFTRLRPRQERTLKVKHFIPPKTYAPELYVLEASADEVLGIFSTGSNSAVSNRYSNSSSSLLTPETGRFSVHKRIPPIVDNARTQTTQTGNDGWTSQDGGFVGIRTNSQQRDYYRSADPASKSELLQQRIRAMVPLEQWSTAVDDLDDLESNNKASQTEFDPLDDLAVIDGAESLPMLIELAEDPEVGEQTGLGEDGGNEHSTLSATPAESNQRVDDEQRRMLDELFRKQREDELRLQEEKRKLEEEQRAWESKKLKQSEEAEERARLLAEQQSKLDEQKTSLDERRRENELRIRDEAVKTEALHVQAMEEQRKIDQEWAEFNRNKQILEEQRKKDEQEKTQKLEQRAQQNVEKAALLKAIDELRSNRLKAEQDRDDLMNRARQLQGKARNNRSLGRDAWKKKYFEEKRKTVPLEEQSRRLRTELDVLHKKILTQMDHNGRRDTTSRAMTSYSVGSVEPSPQQNNLKIVAVRQQHEIESVQRRIADINMKLTAEMKLRNQVEVELRAMKAELAHRRSVQVSHRAGGPNSVRAMNTGPPSHWSNAKQTALV